MAALANQQLAETIRETLSSGSPVPNGLWEGVLERLPEAGLRSEPVGSWKSIKVAWWATAVVLFAVPGGWWALDSRTADSNTIEVRKLSGDEFPADFREPEQLVRRIQDDISKGTSKWVLSP